MNIVNDIAETMINDSLSSLDLSQKKEWFKDFSFLLNIKSKSAEPFDEREFSFTNTEKAVFKLSSISSLKYLFEYAFFGQTDSSTKAEILEHLSEDKENIKNVSYLLEVALKKQEKGLFKQLMKNNSLPIKLRDDSQRDWLVQSYEMGCTDMFKFLLNNKWNPDTRFLKNTTLLNYSIEKEDKYLFNTMLNFGANPNIENDFDKGETPLIKACKKNNYNYRTDKKLEYFIKELISHGADFNQKNKYNISPIYYALLNRNKIALKILSEYPVDFSHKTGKKENGKSPYEYLETLKNKERKLDNETFSMIESSFIKTLVDNNRKKRRSVSL